MVVERPVAVGCAQVVVPRGAPGDGADLRGVLRSAVRGVPARRESPARTERRPRPTSWSRSSGRQVWRPGVVGTTGVRIDGRVVPFDRTTPEAPDLQRLSRGWWSAGVRAAAMEVSSHGLDQHRVDGTRVACAVFTNLSQDHLDYHGTMEAYFDGEGATVHARAVRARRGRRRHGRGRAAWPDTRPSPSSPSASAEPAPTSRRPTWRSARPAISFRIGDLTIRSPLRGPYNVSNCLAACVGGASGRRGRRRAGRRASRRCPACPGGSSRWTRVRRSRSSSTTRTRPTAWRTCCGRRASSQVTGA